MVYVYLLLGIIFFSMLLIRSTNILMSGLDEITERTKIDAFGITAFFLALATSLPELFVAVTAAIRGNPEISIGNVLGSNIANLSLVLGGAALIAGSVKATDKFINGEVFHTFLAGSLPLILLLDGSLTRFDGLLLLVVYVLYNMTVLQERRHEIVKKEKREAVWWKRWWAQISDRDVERSMGKIVIGVALLIFSADMLVRLAEQVAAKSGVPMILVGLVLVALGTSLPELSFEIVALRKKEANMALGNILGSVVANSTLVLGVTVLIHPLILHDGLKSYLLATLAFIFVFVFFWLFVRTKQRLDRWEGLVLVIIYWLFVIFEFVKIQNGHLLV